MKHNYQYKYYFVYKTTCLVNGKIYVGYHRTDKIEDGYIGNDIYKTKDAKGEAAFPRAVRKHKYENFKREVIEFCQTLEQCRKREIFWVAELHAQDDKVGYNILPGGLGGDTISKHPNREEICKKISNKLRGIKRPSFTEEHCQHMSEARIGKRLGEKQSQETCKLKSTVLKNRPIETCPWCGFQSNGCNMNAFHFDNCKQNPNHIPKEKKPDTREILTCEHCGYQSKSKSNMKNWHFDNCKQNPNYIPKLDLRPLKICEFCGIQGKGVGMKRFHGINCKHNSNKNIVNTESKTA